MAERVSVSSVSTCGGVSSCARGAAAVQGVSLSDLGHGADRDAWNTSAPARLVLSGLSGDHTYAGLSAFQLQRPLGLGRYETAWAMLQKLRRAMIRPESATASAASSEADEPYLGGVEEGRGGGRRLHSGRCSASRVSIAPRPTAGYTMLSQPDR